MSYLILDRTKITFQSPQMTRGGIILSQVLDSPVHPPKPVLISGTTELDIYFGREFKERHYFEELLSNGVTLLLSPSIKPEYTETPIIDISEWPSISQIDVGNGHYVDLLYLDQLPENPREDAKYYVGSEKKYYIYFDNSWIPEDFIPTEITTKNNRSHLRINRVGWGKENNLTWCWPGNEKENLNKEYRESILDSLKSRKEDDEVYSGFSLDFTNCPSEGIRGSHYLIVPIPEEDKKIQFYIDSPLPPDIMGGEKIKISGESLESQVMDILGKLQERGWIVLGDWGGKVFRLYTKDLLPDLQFYDIPGLIFKGDTNLSHNIYTSLSEDYKRIEFTSKAIGKGAEDIHVKISKIPGKTEWYRVILEYYDYQEVYEGPLYLEEDPDTGIFRSLESTVNRNSLLVTLKVYKDGFSKSNPSDGLPEGSYTLSRSTPEDSFSPDDRWRGIEALSDFEVSEDFLMVPRIEDFLRIGVKEDESWYSEYKDLLEYSNLKNCQVLISNHPYFFGCNLGKEDVKYRPLSPEVGKMYLISSANVISAESWDGESWTVWGKSDGSGRWFEIQETFNTGYTTNHIFNYLEPDNRLVYFYQDMTLKGWERPGWYLFLRGILSGDYSMTSNFIIYPSPSPYYTEDEIKTLEKYKTNFLSYNGHVYYYRKLFSHPGDWKYNNTILSRFCIDKVSNTVSRDFSGYLGKETIGEILTGLNGILGRLKSRYSLMSVLELDHVEEDIYNQKLSVFLDLGIRETLDKDVKLSVTLNFNFT